MSILEIKNLTKTYNNKFTALSDVNLSVADNSFLALLGKNGAGKSTFIGIISSLIRKTSGTVIIDGKDLDKDSLAIKNILGIVPQELNLAVFEKPLQILVNQAGYFGIEARVAERTAEKYLKMLDLWQKRNSPVMALSGGMKRRLMLARALMHDPKILFLDEPTTGVDVEIRYKIWEVLKSLQKEGKTIVLTTHYLEEAEKLCDSVAIIDNGLIKYQKTMQTALLNNVYYKITLESKNKKTELEKFIAETKGKPQSISSSTVEVVIEDNICPLNKVLHYINEYGFKVDSIKQTNSTLEDLFNKITSNK